MILVSIFDKVANTYYKPFTAHNIADATRQLSLAANDPQSPLNQAPNDYAAYKVGVWDPELGTVTPHAHVAVPFQIPLPKGGESA
nr:MAG: nonstructural protein [Microvirus sp.]